MILIITDVIADIKQITPIEINSRWSCLESPCLREFSDASYKSPGMGYSWGIDQGECVRNAEQVADTLRGRSQEGSLTFIHHVSESQRKQQNETLNF